MSAPRIAVLERNRAVLQRSARIVSATAGLVPVAAGDDPEQVRAQLAPDAQLMLCDAVDADLALEWSTRLYPGMKLAFWNAGEMPPLCTRIARHAQIVSLLGWPSFQSMPRPWEIGLVTRNVLDPGRDPTHVAEVFANPPHTAKFRPRTSADRDAVVAEISTLAERAGAGARLAARVGEVAHELIMNAMYDAPADEYGRARYAHDRTVDITLDDADVPIVRFGTDGLMIGIQVTDPFGRLTRDHVAAGIARGAAGASDDASAQVVDTSGGGAGLGLWRIYTGSAVTIIDLLPGQQTSVLAYFDMDVAAREARTMPPSLHLIERPPLAG
ncbi:MAG: hypothetical protein KBG28_10625 [Kofleriaceae bacterium]|jgi:hypothetical protein|nr:hypothetical protein [Kofleriaceae bacterium]MBP6837625.1 hypothetical protein [Kofleriaceae bacterium]MBP9204410.1 hypothetical protein [Kofleriaceae bacterium]